MEREQSWGGAGATLQLFQGINIQTQLELRVDFLTNIFQGGKRTDTLLKISYLLYSQMITGEGESVKSDSEVMRFCEMS